MAREGLARFPPDRLPALTDRGIAFLRPLWIALLAATIVIDIAGTVFAWRDFAERDLVFARIGLQSAIEDDGSVSVAGIPLAGGAAVAVPEGTRLRAIDGRPIPPGARIWEVAERIDTPPGRTVRLTFERPDGRLTASTIRASDAYAREAEAESTLSRYTRMTYRLALSLATCVTLIACAALLFLRRPSDPVAMLFSFSFLLFAATIDPPLVMWVGLGLGVALDVLSTLAWMLLVFGLATFPDGRFVPRALRWSLPAAPVLAVMLNIDRVQIGLQGVIAFAAPLVLVAFHWVRYRRYEEGVERQQIKWSSFGFAAGLIFVAASFLMLSLAPLSGASAPYYAMVMLLLMDAGFLLMALGLMVSLIRFRLWEADRVISKSAVAAGVTLLVAIIWTMSIDFVKSAVELVLGEENAAIATITGAVLAAGIFTPTQALALRWTKERLQSQQGQIEKLVARLAVWRSAESPDEIAQRALAALAAATHAGSAAIVVDTNRGRALLAARGLAEPETVEEAGWTPEGDPRFPIALPLEDEDGPVGLLLAGPRSDANRYNADEMESFRMVTEPLAEALRTARRRAEENETMRRVLGSVEERLARLEDGGPRLSPT